jgi:hypothetical protein
MIKAFKSTEMDEEEESASNWESSGEQEGDDAEFSIEKY